MVALNASDAAAENSARLGANLRSLRARRGLNQSEIATLAGLARAHYSALEAGSSSNGTNANPRLNTLIHLAHALDVALDELIVGLVPVGPPQGDDTPPDV